MCLVELSIFAYMMEENINSLRGQKNVICLDDHLKHNHMYMTYYTRRGFSDTCTCIWTLPRTCSEGENR